MWTLACFEAGGPPTTLTTDSQQLLCGGTADKTRLGLSVRSVFRGRWNKRNGFLFSKRGGGREEGFSVRPHRDDL